jgi:iron complex outermembrane receptor protein
LIWGGNYRSSSDRIQNSATLAFLPANTDLDLASLFFEDHIALVPDRLELTLGSRWEHNDYTGMEVQPSARLSWKVLERQFLWAAISRAVRTPSRIDRNLFSPSAPPFLLAGGPDFRSEKVNAYEVGYRANPNPRTSVAVSAFYNDYKSLRTVEPVPGTGTLVLGNGMEGSTHGVEIWGDIALTDSWRFKGAVTRFCKRICDWRPEAATPRA